MYYETIQSVHSILAYAALGLLVLASINAIFGLTSKKFFTDKDLRLSLFTLIICHIQLLVGMILYFISPMGSAQLGNMKDAAMRLTSLEHPLINIIALVLITIGWSKHKKEESNNGKFKKIAIFYTLGLVLILSRLPWANWFN
jgi:NADH:ubiquinone oxidoreductase subunit 2 (subunit N)